MNPLLATTDGLTLRLRDWPCEGARGSVVLVHGLGENIARYEHIAEELRRGGRHVIGYDQRGHGASEGARGRLAHPESLLADLGLVIDAVRARWPGPLVLLGHSMGGLVAARFVAGGLQGRPVPAWYRPVDALVLSSPALAASLSAWQQLLLKVLSPLAPDFALGSGIKSDFISRDPAVVQASLANPLSHDRVTARLVRFIVDAGEFVRAHAPRWQVPTLLMYAGHDRVVPPAASAAFAAAAPPAIVSTRVFETLYHEIFNEPEKAEVFAALAAWLDRPAGGREAG